MREPILFLHLLFVCIHGLLICIGLLVIGILMNICTFLVRSRGNTWINTAEPMLMKFDNNIEYSSEIIIIDWNRIFFLSHSKIGLKRVKVGKTGNFL